MDVLRAEGPIASVVPEAQPRVARTWPAALLLFFLAPMLGEMLSGSTPPLAFINPFSLLFLTGLYGSGALLVRETVRRRGLGWRSVVLLGAAYGVLEEGLALTTWFNPYWPDAQALGAYGRALDTNWVWAIALTTFHAIFSITIPILYVEALFPRIAARQWLGLRMRRAVAVWLGLVSAFTLLLFGFVAYKKPQCSVARGIKTCLPPYPHPPVMWFGALAIAVALVAIGLRLRPATPRASGASTKRAPGLWRLRFFGLFATILFFALQWSGPSVIPSAAVTVALIAALDGLVALIVVRWSKRDGWGVEQWVALATGVDGFFVLLAPLLETHPAAGKPTAGMTLAALLWLIFFIVISRRVGARAKTPGVRDLSAIPAAEAAPVVSSPRA